MTGRVPRLLSAALAAARRGWPVFPVAPYGKRLGRLAAAGVVDEPVAVDRLLQAARSHVGVGDFSMREAERAILNGLRHVERGRVIRTPPAAARSSAVRGSRESAA